MRNVIVLALAIAFSSFFASSAEAKQYTRQVHGREVVVHSNPIPVILHRMVPPQHGRHMTERELTQGKLPQSGRYLGSIGR